MQEAKRGANVAVSVEGITFGRQLKDGDVLQVFLNDDEERALKYKFESVLSDDDKDLLEKLDSIKAKTRKVS
jgi:translation initiation factor 5B